MAELTFARNGEIDIITLTGVVKENDLIQLAKTISTLRQQGCMNIIWNGKGIDRIAVRDLEILANPIRIFRNVGGKFALAEFEDRNLSMIQRTSWKKFLNIFKTETEAITFLDPNRSD
ncbi:MAG: hypothetical protein C4527_20285 [Candidatus Omnitrophota bacterium]|jgi:hypothetical protein|nr:MAG: hypothetical protein C4527_20285 [Candidatus Omnitrophota bacterium]